MGGTRILIQLQADTGLAVGKRPGQERTLLGRSAKSYKGQERIIREVGSLAIFKSRWSNNWYQLAALLFGKGHRHADALTHLSFLVFFLC